MSTDSTYLQAILAHYPNALSTDETVHRHLDLLHARFNLMPEQILLADSICSDDLNAIEYPRRAFQMLGPFKLGGLNGFPFTGLTGMNAFVNHVPADGAVFIFYAPHIGIQEDGTVGSVLRPGQSTPSACCGATQAALKKLLAGEIQPHHMSELDYQENTLEQILLARQTRIRAAAVPIMEATEVTYEAIEERIETLLDRVKFVCRYVILMGGILINATPEMGSFCALRRFACLDVTTGQRQNLLPELLG